MIQSSEYCLEPNSNNKTCSSVQLCLTYLRPLKENDVIVEWMGRYLSGVYSGCQMDKQ